MPRDRAALEQLPGVGRKTANVVLNIAFGEPTIAVDTHIFRVGNRTGLAPGKTPLEVEQKLEKRVPPDRKLHAHHWLILHGRYVCKARKPDCPVCSGARPLRLQGQDHPGGAGQAQEGNREEAQRRHHPPPQGHPPAHLRGPQLENPAILGKPHHCHART